MKGEPGVAREHSTVKSIRALRRMLVERVPKTSTVAFHTEETPFVSQRSISRRSATPSIQTPSVCLMWCSPLGSTFAVTICVKSDEGNDEAQGTCSGCY